MQRFGLRDDQWERIKDLLPGREGHVGGNAADNRLFVDAVLYRYRTGVPWRDLPARLRQACEKFPRRGAAGCRYNPPQLNTGPRPCIQLGGVCQGTEQNQTRNTVL